MLHKHGSLEIKSADEAGVVEGYGSTFDNEPDSYGDVIIKGAYEATLSRHKSAGTMPLMLWGHQSSELPIGDWKEMGEDKNGLWVKGQLDLDDPVGQRVHRAIKRKSVRGLSIGFEISESRDDPKRKGVRLLEKIDLWEVSPVNFPAKTQAMITDVKSILLAGDLPSLPEFEKFLREAGFSKSQATAIAGKGLSHLFRSESGSATEDAAKFFAAIKGTSPLT